MNKDFVRPLILIVVTILVLGLIAQFIPGCESGKIKVKPFKWFSQLKEIGKQDSISAAVVAAAKISSELVALDPFMQKLQTARSGGSVRIAYFGDSIIEGDLITAQLRNNLQAQYGGSGVGLVPITSIVAGFRQTIRHTFSKNFEAVSLMNAKGSINPGFGGYVFIPRNYFSIEKPVEVKPTQDISPASDSLADSTKVAVPAEPAPEPKTVVQKQFVNTNPWVEYAGANIAGGSQTFSRIRLFYSHAKANSWVIVSRDGSAAEKYTLRAGESVQALDLSGTSPVSRIRLEFSASDPIHLYGVSFDQNTGVYVDNISIRGHSGMYFDRITTDNIRDFQRYMDYDLIVLQYGENVSSPTTKDYSFYYKGMLKTIEHIRGAIPNIPILMISAHDRSVNQAGGFMTSPDIPILVTTQAKIAKDTGSAFWNLLDAMGGLNSMRDWVKANPPLASKDFTHFNRAGANKIGDMLTKVITKGG